MQQFRRRRQPRQKKLLALPSMQPPSSKTFGTSCATVHSLFGTLMPPFFRVCVPFADILLSCCIGKTHQLFNYSQDIDQTSIFHSRSHFSLIILFPPTIRQARSCGDVAHSRARCESASRRAWDPAGSLYLSPTLRHGETVFDRCSGAYNLCTHCEKRPIVFALSVTLCDPS